MMTQSIEHFDLNSFTAWATRRARAHQTKRGKTPTLPTVVNGWEQAAIPERTARLFDHGFVVDCAPVWSRGELEGHEYAIISRTYCADTEIDNPPEGLKTIRLPREVLGRDPGTAVATVIVGPGPGAVAFLKVAARMPAMYFAGVLSRQMAEGGYLVGLEISPLGDFFSVPLLVHPSPNTDARARP